jgi:uncharacterized protein
MKINAGVPCRVTWKGVPVPRFRLSLLTLVLLLHAAPCLAEDDSAGRQTAARALIGEMHTPDNMTQLAGNIVNQVKIAVTRGDPTLMKHFDTFAPRLRDEVEAEKSKLLDRIVDVYARGYTVDELQQMTAFYKTPLGQKILATQMDVSTAILQLTRDWASAVSRTIASEARVNLQSAD